MYTVGPVAAAGANMWYPQLQPAPAHHLGAAGAGDYMYVPVQVYDDTDYVELELPDIADPANAGAQAALQAANQLMTNMEEPKTVLRVIIEHMLYPVTIDVIKQIFSRYGQVLKIVTFSKNNTFQALIQYSDAIAAQTAKVSLNGQNIYNGCCTLRIDFSKLPSLNVKYNNDKSRDYTNPNLPAGDGSPGMPGMDHLGGFGAAGTYGNHAAAAQQMAAMLQATQSPLAGSTPGHALPGISPQMAAHFQHQQAAALSPHHGGLAGLQGAGGDAHMAAAMKQEQMGGAGGHKSDPYRLDRNGNLNSTNPGGMAGMPPQQHHHHQALGALGGMGLTPGMQQLLMQQQQQQQAQQQQQQQQGMRATQLPFGLAGLPNQAALNAVAGGMRLPGQTCTTGSVLLVSNLNEEKVTPDALFTLFGVYGDVIRVKIMFNKKDNALIQFTDASQAQCAMTHVDKLKLWSKQIKVAPSKHAVVQMPKEGQPDAGLTKDYTNSPLHRFKKPNSKNHHNIFPPSATLHLSNIPPTTEEDQLKELFVEHGEVVAFKFFQKDRKMALIQMSTIEEAVHGLIASHNHQLAETSHLRVSFSKSTIHPASTLPPQPPHPSVAHMHPHLVMAPQLMLQ